MAKIVIEIEDVGDQVGVGVTISEFAEDSKACQMGARVTEYIDQIADRHDSVADEPFDIHRISPSLRLADGSRARKGGGIILPN